MRLSFTQIVLLFLLLLGLIFQFSCSKSSNSRTSKIIASVGEKELYSSDLEKAYPGAMIKADSLSFARKFVNNWITRQLKLEKAKLNLTSEQLNFEKQIEEYRTTLILYEYEKNFVSQKLDTIISDDQLREYFEKYGSDFLLDKAMIQAYYIKFPKTIRNYWTFKSRLKKYPESNVEKVEEFIDENAIDFEDFNGSWVPLDSINSKSEKFGLSIENLQADEIIDCKDEFHHVVKLAEVRKQGEPAPFNAIKSQLAEIILNKRKTELLKSLNNEVLEDGRQKKLFKVYDY